MYELLRELELRKEKEVRAQIEKEEILRTIKVTAKFLKLTDNGPRAAHHARARTKEGA